MSKKKVFRTIIILQILSFLIKKKDTQFCLTFEMLSKNTRTQTES